MLPLGGWASTPNGLIFPYQIVPRAVPRACPAQLLAANGKLLHVNTMTANRGGHMIINPALPLGI